MRASVLGIGAWLPETVRTNDAWPASFAAAHAAREAELTAVGAGDRGDRIDAIVARSSAPEADDPFLGTTRRRVAAIGAREAEALAAKAALADAGVDPRDVDAVLSSSAVPDRITPPSAPAVAHAIGATRAFAFGVDAVCASAIAQLEIATSLVEAGRARIVVLTQSHIMTRAFPLAHPASPNVGDAATAIVVGATERRGVLATAIATDGAYHDAVVWRRPKDADSPWYEPGGAMCMGTYDGAAARRLIQDTVRIGATTLGELARASGVATSSVDALASVQPRRWVPGAIAEAAGLDPARAPTTFDEHAHLGACGVVVNLLEARRLGLVASGAKVALYGQGAGFTRAAALLHWA